MRNAISKHLDKLTEEMLDSYRQHPSTHRIDERALPSRSRIVEILSELRRVLFPGFFGRKELPREGIRYMLGDTLLQIGADLGEQIAYCLYAKGTAKTDGDMESCRRRAADLALEFLSRLPAVREMLAYDAEAAYDGDPAAESIDEIIYCYPGYYAITVYRISHELHALGVPLMPRIMTEHAHGLTGTDIHPGAKIGRRFFIDHATGVVIGETTEIGDTVKIYQGVTLGAKSFPRDERGRIIKGLKRHPTIEDDVTIYANATILGGDTVIGRGVTVAGNTFVMESVSAESLVTHEAPRLTVKSKRSRQ